MNRLTLISCEILAPATALGDILAEVTKACAADMGQPITIKIIPVETHITPPPAKLRSRYNYRPNLRSRRTKSGASRAVSPAFARRPASVCSFWPPRHSVPRGKTNSSSLLNHRYPTINYNHLHALPL